jgi:hypothetical protein
MGEAQNSFFEPTFNRSIKVGSRDERITSDAGVLLVREADHRLGITERIGEQFLDPRDPTKIRYTMTELLRERIYAMTLGYRPADDLDRLAHDPAMRMATWDRPGDKVLQERLASQPTQSRLIDSLQDRFNREILREGIAESVFRHLRASGQGRAVQRATLDVDGFPIIARGLQTGSAYNGHYQNRVYYPLVAGFAPRGNYGDARLGSGFVHAMLRKGTAASAEGAVRFIRKAIRKCETHSLAIDVRFDSAFTIGRIMDPLTEDGTKFVGRLTNNRRLDKLAERYLTRPVGRPPSEGYETIIELGQYEVDSWRHTQRLVLVVVDKPDPKTGMLDLCPYHFFLVTNWSEKEKPSQELLDHYRQRGTFEDRIGELSQAVSANLSSPEFQENESILLLSMLAFNLLSILRSELESSFGTGWDLSRVQTSVLKAGGRVVTKGHRLLIDVATAVRPLWKRLIARIWGWNLRGFWSEPKGSRRRMWVRVLCLHITFGPLHRSTIRNQREDRDALFFCDGLMNNPGLEHKDGADVWRMDLQDTKRDGAATLRSPPISKTLSFDGINPLTVIEDDHHSIIIRPRNYQSQRGAASDAAARRG